MGALAILLVLTVSVLAACEASSASPVVNLRKGAFRGYSIVRDGQTIYAFEGIPYARPPVGERRFQDPEEAEAWTGERNATAFGANCMQILQDDIIIGDEDCLFLNVYTNAPPETWWQSAKRPVVVWIHGGAFQLGSGDMGERGRPDLLVGEGLVFVSINYRLGVMGFMNTEDSAAPGNAGLKDAVLALKWVKENIAAFGGDPEQVTIFGQSAGGAAVHYLTLSPLAEGLFKGAIIYSGTAVTSNMIMEEPRRTAERLRGQVECEEGLDLLPCFQGVDAKVLVAFSTYTDPDKVELDFCKDAFLPSVETPGTTDTPFLPQAPEVLIYENPVPSVPLFIGTTDADSIIFLKLGGAFLDDPSRWQTLDDDFVNAFQPDLPFGLRTEENVRKMREYYIGEHQLTEAQADNDTLYGFIRMTTDLYFGIGTVRSAEAAANRGAPVYLYEFTYDSVVMEINKQGFYNASFVAGVAHSDELPYVFSLDFQPPPTETAVRKRTVSMMANFIKTGNPTPQGSSLPHWPAYDQRNQQYADMGEEFTVSNTPLQGRMAFWRELLESSRVKRNI